MSADERGRPGSRELNGAADEPAHPRRIAHAGDRGGGAHVITQRPFPVGNAAAQQQLAAARFGAHAIEYEPRLVEQQIAV